MGLYTGTVKGLSRAPYRDQVQVHLINLGAGNINFSPEEEAKLARVQRFLHPGDCAREIVQKREKCCD